MRRLVTGTLALLLLWPALRADDRPAEKPKDKEPSAAAKQLQALVHEVQDTQEELTKAYREAKSPEAREKIVNGFKKKLVAFAGRALQLAEKNPKDEAALEALSFAVSAGQDSPTAQKAANLLLKNYANTPELPAIAQELAASGAPAGEKLLRDVLAQTKDHKTQAQLTLALAKLLKDRADKPEVQPAAAAKMQTEAERLLTRLLDKYGDVKGVPGEAKRDLFEIRHLSIGKKAPDISGTDADGKKFKLSDYRGKVVVLDFWATH